MATETYRFDGASEKTRVVGSVDLTQLTKGSDNEQGVIPVKGYAELTEEQVADLKSSGLKFVKASDEEKAKLKEQKENEGGILAKRGADQTDPEAVIAARAAQQESQDVESTTPTPANPRNASGSRSGGRGGNQGDES